MSRIAPEPLNESDNVIVDECREILDRMGLSPTEKAIVATIADKALQSVVLVFGPQHPSVFTMMKATVAIMAHTVGETAKQAGL